jgi:putative PIN family toxin of toxin-antitoxin system
MRVILDTNVLVSAILSPGGNADIALRRWLDGRFVLLTCSEQLAEVRSTLRKPYVARHYKPHDAGRLVNLLSTLTLQIERLPAVRRSADPQDDFLLALAQAGEADYLVTGDKAGLLALKRHARTRILTAAQFAQLFK